MGCTGVFVRRRKFGHSHRERRMPREDIERLRHRGKPMRRWKQIGWSGASTSQGTLKIANNDPGKDPPLGQSERAGPYRHFNFGLLASQIFRG